MTALRFLCNPVDVYSIFDVPAWVEKERLNGHAAFDAGVSVEVIHGDREMEGSCRWCGAREHEVVVVDSAGRLVHRVARASTRQMLRDEPIARVKSISTNEPDRSERYPAASA